MNWIALSTPENVPLPPGPAAAHAACPPRDGLIPRGGLVMEVDLGRDTGAEETLLLLHRQGDLISHVSFHRAPGGQFAFAQRLGKERRQQVLAVPAPRCVGSARLTLSWDCASGRGLFALELLQEGTLVRRVFANPLPWRRADIAELEQGGPGAHVGPAIGYFGLSDRPLPVGLAPSLATGTPVRTAEGYVPVERLRPGDMIETLSHGPLPLCHTHGWELPARGLFRPVRLLAPFMGLRRDVMVAAGQRLVLGGADVEYMFGAEAVLVEARALAGTIAAHEEGQARTIRYHHVLLEQHAVLDVAGCAMESLYMGGVSGQPELLATSFLGGLAPEALPRHDTDDLRTLSDYEAAALLAAMSRL
ncbi:hypothetical protein Ga0609869_000938 [Rhodovulum iodosum]|uniref:Hedgehog/Intein (Hint) domain-containing protein n=1 Tax=Rhodovulum iodosum TaxID=68291 RepID=A0ABV3XS23_9RHOB|nr:Hint domain-containing protein [Rhodovulum robiginosum]RSK32980.1 hypothetical protein EJA01_11740 [Rhodovulum robiginosum]